jgi:hypothetical protein
MRRFQSLEETRINSWIYEEGATYEGKGSMSMVSERGAYSKICEAD